MNPSGAAARDPGASRSQGEREGALMSIGEVLAHLRTEFPDTTISKLRFLEAEGLVDPQRTASGYRKYSWNDVARLRFVLTAQRDQYLPLRVIREQLDRMEQEPVVPQRPTLVAVGAQRATDPADSRIPKDDLVERTGIDEALLAELEQIGLVVARPPGWYDADAVIIVEAVAGLTRFGLEVRHLRAFKNSADREVGLFTQLLAPLARQHDPAARARASDTARELQALSQRLHAALVRTGLRGELGR
ncbi:MerR family transcriptional regulator [Actinoplanes regularis]|nr:MerR family transcriptional regulator [Actinoplanes regularis]